MNKSILLATIAVLMVAGCTGPGGFQLPFPITSPTGIAAGNGLVITEFSLDNSEVYNNRSAKVTMMVSNKGGSTVPNAKALAVLQGSAIKPTLADNLYWSGRGTTTSVYLGMGKEMSPYDPVKDMPADEKTLDWYLTSPTGITAGTTRTDYFMGRLYYDYSTTVTGNVWIYTEAESEAAKSANKPLNTNSFTTSAGPVAMYVTIKPSAVVVSDTDRTFTMTIKVINTGGGTVYKQGAVTYDTTSPDLVIDTETQLNRVAVDITAPSGWSGFTDCESTDLEFVKGEATLTCEVTVPVPATFQSDQISVVANYGYWIERTASIVVAGK
jgi:hypothetical protein